MTIYRLPPEPVFPPPDHAEPEGLLAVGGDLSSERLLEAYRNGIFPWYSDGEPICWWSPDPRFTLVPHELHVSQRLNRVIRSQRYTIRYDTMFDAVVGHCATTPRPGQDGTWITPEMRAAYIQMHRHGLAHSVETRRDGQLVGGVYGVALGGMFAGESMFYGERDASKVALASLVDHLRRRGYNLMDIQQLTSHTASQGATEIARDEYLDRLAEAIALPVTFGDCLETGD